MVSTSLRVLLLLAGSSMTGCLAPPALLDATNVDLGSALIQFPGDAVPVKLETQDGVSLGGIFVPAGEGAPIVLHLMESSGSIGSSRLSFGPLTSKLADLGFASLAFDYEGVGLSSGRRSVDHLERDARLFYAEALRRAGGDPERVVVRGTSLGTLAAATLLDEGERPGALVLLAPVRSGTATERFAGATYGSLVRGFAALAYRDIVDVNLFEVLEGLAEEEWAVSAERPRLFVSAPTEDFFLTDDERERLEALVLRAQGTYVGIPGSHISGAVHARFGLEEELEFLARLFPPQAPDPEELERLLELLVPRDRERFAAEADRERLAALAHLVRTTPARLVAALSLATSDPIQATRLAGVFRERHYPSTFPGEEAMDLDEFAEVLSLADPAGELDVDWLSHSSRFLDVTSQIVSYDLPPEWVPDISVDEDAHFTTRVTISSMSMTEEFRYAAIHADLLERGLAPADAKRQATRILLRMHRIPERVRPGPSGDPEIEVYTEGAWVSLPALIEERGKNGRRMPKLKGRVLSVRSPAMYFRDTGDLAIRAAGPMRFDR